MIFGQEQIRIRFLLGQGFDKGLAFQVLRQEGLFLCQGMVFRNLGHQPILVQRDPVAWISSVAAEQTAAEPVFPEPFQESLVPCFLDMDPDPRIILLEGPEDLRKPAGSDAVIAAHKQFSLFQPKDPSTFLPDLPAPIKEFSDGGQ